MTIEDKALALFNEVLKERGVKPYTYLDLDAVSNKALCRAIEQHEATEQELSDLRQKVSDAVVSYFYPYDSPPVFQQFIIPKPKPDPLARAVSEANAAGGEMTGQWIADFRAALGALGFEIREKNDG